MHPVHYHVISVDLDKIRPTQVSIGYEEVIKKRSEWRKLSKKDRKALLNSHWFPSVTGPKGEHFIVDHHHLGLALHLEEQSKVNLTVLKDFSMLNTETFWRVMEFHQWVHPYDERGNRIPFSKIPVNVSQLRDDPYRSLAGLARDHGAFAKDLTPYSEFLWADFFRVRIDKKFLKKWDLAIEKALICAQKQEASYLPGWTHPKSDKKLVG